MDLKWTNYVLPGDISSTAREINAAGECIERAIGHLLSALSEHGQGDFVESRKLVNQAVERLKDWERSDNEMVNALDRKLKDVRMRKKLQMIEQFRRQGVEIEVIIKKQMT